MLLEQKNLHAHTENRAKKNVGLRFHLAISLNLSCCRRWQFLL